ncbi:MAG: class I SAM-dependent methyltransferase [Nanoarchaeota archaeon]
MPDEHYAEAWIKHANSGKDYHRRTFMYPFIENVAKSLNNPKVLDVGCGWGDALKVIHNEGEYIGIDPTSEFFDYVLSKYGGRNITLKEGGLPSNTDVSNNHFDLVLCVLVIHYTLQLKESVRLLFSKAKKGGKVVLVDFRDDAEKDVRDKFSKVYESSERHIRGIFDLSEDNHAEVEYYFHREREMENEIEKYGDFKKEYLGPVFVGYECTKK